VVCSVHFPDEDYKSNPALDRSFGLVPPKLFLNAIAIPRAFENRHKEKPYNIYIIYYIYNLLYIYMC
jgi:hypothetical protein